MAVFGGAFMIKKDRLKSLTLRKRAERDFD